MPSKEYRGRRRVSWPAMVWAVLGALGILSAAGVWLFNISKEKIGDIVLQPLTANVTEFEWPAVYSFPASVDPSGAPPPDDRFVPWATKSGAVAYQRQLFRLVVRARKSTPPVIVTDVELHVVRPLEPLGQRWVAFPEAGGDGMPRRTFTGSLAGDVPRVHFFSESGKEEPIYGFPVVAGKPELFSLDVCPGEGIVSYEIVIRYDVNGRSGRYTVRNRDGEPFRVAGGGRPAVYVWDHSRRPPALVRVGAKDSRVLLQAPDACR